MNTRECPKCGAEMEKQDYEPDVGLFGGWFCHACCHTEGFDDNEDWHTDGFGDDQD